jgi:hypothetical protein
MYTSLKEEAERTAGAVKIEETLKAGESNRS